MLNMLYENLKEAKYMNSICSEEELEWLANVDFSMYEGKYVAIVGKKVAAFGDNAKLVWEEAKRKFPGSEPIIEKVPKGDLLIY